MPAVTAAARRAKRIVESESEDTSIVDELEDELDEDDEEDELEDEEGQDGSEHEPSSEPPSDGEADEAFDSRAVSPIRPGLKIKLRVDSSATREPVTKKRGGAPAPAPAKKKRNRDESEDDFDDEESTRSVSPSKMTARQRAKLEGDLTGGLLALPAAPNALPKPELTEAERVQKREEMARRRKRQNEQRLQDEQDQTINRLLRAQTGRSRSKLDNTTPDESAVPSGRASGLSSPVKRSFPSLVDGVRYVSKMDGDKLVQAVAVRPGREEWLDITSTPVQPKQDARECGVSGCGKPRKYRCTAAFELGGCSMEHLKEVEKRVTTA